MWEAQDFVGFAVGVRGGGGLCLLAGGAPAAFRLVACRRNSLKLKSVRLTPMSRQRPAGLCLIRATSLTKW